MGLDLLTFPEVAAKFEAASAMLGWSVAETIASEADKVSNTLYTQPCLYVVESALVDLLRQRGYQPDLVAGHSLGEYGALYAAGVFNFEAGLDLVQHRAKLMAQASDGMMAALIGFDRDELMAKLAATPDVVLANDNNAGQVVISGTPAAVDAVLSSVKAKRGVKLNVSGAFHSPLMAPAAAAFEAVLAPVAFASAQVPVLSNVDPSPSRDAALLKQRLSQQMTGSVRWREISLALAEQGMEQVIEVGPGNVLTGLIKRTCKDLSLINVGSLPQLEAIGG